MNSYKSVSQTILQLTIQSGYVLPAIKKILHGNIPKLTIYNKMGFSKKPPELQMHQLEETLIAPIIPFMSIQELPVALQKCLHGNVCHVPVEVSATVNNLPRTLNDMQTVSVKLKRKKQYHTSVFTENVRPAVVLKALHYLVQNSDRYTECNVQIDEAWLTQLLGKNPENALYINEEFCKSHNINTNPVDLNIQNINDIDSDEEHNEIDFDETYTGNTDTILQTSKTDVSYITHIKYSHV